MTLRCRLLVVFDAPGLEVSDFKAMKVGQLIIEPPFLAVDLERSHGIAGRVSLNHLTDSGVIDIDPVHPHAADVEVLAIARELGAVVAKRSEPGVNNPSSSGIHDVHVILVIRGYEQPLTVLARREVLRHARNSNRPENFVTCGADAIDEARFRQADRIAARNHGISKCESTVGRSHDIVGRLADLDPAHFLERVRIDDMDILRLLGLNVKELSGVSRAQRERRQRK
jgi:hypothetical protein